MRLPNRAHRLIATSAAFVLGFLLILAVVPSPNDAAADHLLPTTTTTSTTTTEPADDPCGSSLSAAQVGSSTTTTSTTTSSSTTTTTTPDDGACDDGPEITLPGTPTTTTPDSPTTTTPGVPTSTTTTTAPSDPGGGTAPGDDGSDDSTGSGGEDSDGSGGESGSDRSGDDRGSDEVASGKTPSDRAGGSTGTSDPVAQVRGPVIGGVQHVLIGPEAATVTYGNYKPRPGLRSTADIIDRLGVLGGSLPQNTLGQMMAPFPVAGAAHYTDDWGAPRLGHTHEGTDIFAARGTPVIASLDGVVENMKIDSGLGGTTLRIRAADGTYHYYAHLNRHADGLFEGERVSEGDTIGYVGNTGNARTTPPHLHFEIHPGGGGPVPPVPFLDLWLEQARERVGSAMTGEVFQRTVIEASPSYDYYAENSDAAEVLPARLASFTGAGSDEPLGAGRGVTHPAPVLSGSMLAALVWVWSTRPRDSITSPPLGQRFRRA